MVARGVALPECRAVVTADKKLTNIGGDDGRPFAVPAIDDLMEQRGIGGIVLLQAVKADFIDEQDLLGKEAFKFAVQAVVGKPGKDLFEHSGGSGVATAEILPATDEQQGLGKMTFPGPGVASKDKPLLTPGKVHGGQFHDLIFIDHRLVDSTIG